MRIRLIITLALALFVTSCGDDDGLSATTTTQAQATMAGGGERCVGEFEGFVGLSYEQSDLDLFPITPTAESWAQGDRVVYCALYALDLSKLTGSMLGAAR